jgi:hypothetical protein
MRLIDATYETKNAVDGEFQHCMAEEVIEGVKRKRTQFNADESRTQGNGKTGTKTIPFENRPPGDPPSPKLLLNNRTL